MKNWHIHYPPIRAASYSAPRRPATHGTPWRGLTRTRRKREETQRAGRATKKAAGVAALDAAKTEARGFPVGRYGTCDAGHVRLTRELAVTFSRSGAARGRSTRSMLASVRSWM